MRIQFHQFDTDFSQSCGLTDDPRAGTGRQSQRLFLSDERSSAYNPTESLRASEVLVQSKRCLPRFHQSDFTLDSALRVLPYCSFVDLTT